MADGGRCCAAFKYVGVLLRTGENHRRLSSYLTPDSELI